MKNEAFAAYYNNMPRTGRQHIKMRDKIVSACSVSTHVFYNWVRGITQIPHHLHQSIAETTGKDRDELFPTQ